MTHLCDSHRFFSALEEVSGTAALQLKSFSFQEYLTNLKSKWFSVPEAFTDTEFLRRGAIRDAFWSLTTQSHHFLVLRAIMNTYTQQECPRRLCSLGPAGQKAKGTSWTSPDLARCDLDLCAERYPRWGAEGSTDIPCAQQPLVQVCTHTHPSHPVCCCCLHRAATPQPMGCPFFCLSASSYLCRADLLLFPSLVPGRKSPQAECGGEGAAAAKPESRGVERGGRKRCHLQRVPLQGLQPGTSISGTKFLQCRRPGLQSRESYLQGSATVTPPFFPKHNG